MAIGATVRSMAWSELFRSMDDSGVDSLAATLDALERGGLGALLDPECGPRRLLPRAVAESFADALAVMDAIEDDDAALIAERARCVDAAMSAVMGAPIGDCDIADNVLLARVLRDAMESTRIEWGRWMLTAGVALGMRA